MSAPWPGVSDDDHRLRFVLDDNELAGLITRRGDIRDLDCPQQEDAVMDMLPRRIGQVFMSRKDVRKCLCLLDC